MAKPNGRPTKYKKSYCDELIEFMRVGRSFREFAGHLEVDSATLYAWIAKHDEFLSAKKRGDELSYLWWCEQARLNLDNKTFNATLWYMNMKNRHGWSDNPTPINVNMTYERPESLIDDDQD